MNRQGLIKACVDQQHFLTRRGWEIWNIIDGNITRVQPGLDNQILTEEEFLEWFTQRICYTEMWLKKSQRLLINLLKLKESQP